MGRGDFPTRDDLRAISQKMDRYDRDVVAHFLNNALAPILVNVDLALEDLGLEAYPDVVEALQETRTAAMALVAMVEDLTKE